MLLDQNMPHYNVLARALQLQQIAAEKKRQKAQATALPTSDPVEVGTVVKTSENTFRKDATLENCDLVLATQDYPPHFTDGRFYYVHKRLLDPLTGGCVMNVVTDQGSALDINPLPTHFRPAHWGESSGAVVVGSPNPPPAVQAPATQPPNTPTGPLTYDNCTHVVMINTSPMPGACFSHSKLYKIIGRNYTGARGPGVITHVQVLDDYKAAYIIDADPTVCEPAELTWRNCEWVKALIDYYDPSSSANKCLPVVKGRAYKVIGKAPPDLIIECEDTRPRRFSAGEIEPADAP